MVKAAPGIHTISSAGGPAGAAGPAARSLTGTACSCSTVGGDRRLEFLHHLVDGEAGGLLARRELLEGLQELGHERRRGQDDEVAVCPALSLPMMSGSPAAARKVGSQSWCWMMSLQTTPAGILPGQRISSGIRKTPSHLVSFSLRNGVIPASGQLFICGPLPVEQTMIVFSAIPSSSSVSSSRPTCLSWSIIVSW